MPPGPQRKKRWPAILGVVVAFLVIVGVIGVLAGGSDTKNAPPSGSSGSEQVAPASGKASPKPKTTEDDGVVSNSLNDEHPPAADVKLTKVVIQEYTNWPLAKLNVTNHSSKASDYLITVEFLDSSGTRVSEGAATLNALGPGKTAKTEAIGPDEVHGKVRAKITEVERFAS